VETRTCRAAEQTFCEILTLPLSNPLFFKGFVRPPRCAHFLPEYPQHSLRFLPGPLHLPHQHAVAALCVPAQFIDTLHQARPNRVEVNIAHQFQEIGFLLALDRSETVLEKVVVSPVGPIIPQRINGQQTPHQRGDRYRPASEKEVKVVRNQHPRIAESLPLLEDLPQLLQEVIPIGKDDIFKLNEKSLYVSFILEQCAVKEFGDPERYDRYIGNDTETGEHDNHKRCGTSENIP
jgi:hypothetical protein